MFKSSVVSFPDRGPWGKSNYRGNCTGHIVKGFVESYQRRKDGLVIDPSVGCDFLGLICTKASTFWSTTSSHMLGKRHIWLGGIPRTPGCFSTAVWSGVSQTSGICPG